MFIGFQFVTAEREKAESKQNCFLSSFQNSTLYNHLQSAHSTNTLRWNSGLTQIVSMHWVAMHWVFSLQKCLFVKFNHWPICKHNTQHFLILQVKCVYPRCAKMNVQNHLWFSHLFNWHIFVISHKMDKGQRNCVYNEGFAKKWIFILNSEKQ